MGAILVVAGDASGVGEAALARLAEELPAHPSETLLGWDDPEAGVVIRCSRWEGEAGLHVARDFVLAVDGDASTGEELAERYRKRGIGGTAGLERPFAFIVWDRVRRRLVLGTDVISHHPLAYFRAGRTLVASTRVLALLRHPEAPRAWDPVSLAHAFGGLEAQPPGTTPFLGIERLLPGTAATLENGALSLHKLDELVATRLATTAARAWTDAFWSLVEARVRPDERACLSLSGGLDSGCLAVARLRSLPSARLATYSITSERYPELDERRRVEAVLRRYPKIDGTFVDASAARATDLFPGPLPDDPRGLALGFEAARANLVRAAAADGYSILLDGEGGDELFDLAGAWWDLLRWGTFGEAARSLIASHRPVGRVWRGVVLTRLPKRVRRHWIARQVRKRSGALAWLRDTPAARAAIEQRAHLYFRRDHRARIETLASGVASMTARHADRMAARALGIRRVSPLLDRPVVELALGIPPELRVGEVDEKPFLRLAARGVLPSEVVDGAKENALHSRLLLDRVASLDPSVLDAAERHPVLAELVDWGVVRRAILVAAQADALAVGRLAAVLRAAAWVLAVEDGYMK